MTQENKLQTLFKDYFALYNPSLSKGVALISMLLDTTLNKGELDAAFSLLCREVAQYLQDTSSTEEKAEIFRLVLFDKLKFKVSSLSDERQLSLKQVIGLKNTTPMFMGVLYLLMAKNFHTPAFLGLSKGQIIVCFEKEYNFPNVYIGLNNNGVFITDSELSARGIKQELQILNTKQIIRYLLSNLIYLYTKQNTADKKQFVQTLIENCL
ncbi:MAG: hypothetical protein J5594_06160 [Elusimicrobiaceae bacterium]|nr:hypothetical protein [Elusimicrobiaceae bacterium]